MLSTSFVPGLGNGRQAWGIGGYSFKDVGSCHHVEGVLEVESDKYGFRVESKAGQNLFLDNVGPGWARNAALLWAD